MNRDLLMRYIEVSTLLLTPICPHVCDHIWVNVLKRKGSALTVGWPSAEEPDYVIRQAAEFLDVLKNDLRAQIQKKEAPPKKKKADAPPPPKITHMDIYVAPRYGGWREAVLRSLAQEYNSETNKFSANYSQAVFDAVKSDPNIPDDFKNQPDKVIKTKILPFAKLKQEQTIIGGTTILDIELPFKQDEIINENKEYL